MQPMGSPNRTINIDVAYRSETDLCKPACSRRRAGNHTWMERTALARLTAAARSNRRRSHQSAQVSTYQGMWGGVSGGVEPEDTSLVDRAFEEVGCHLEPRPCISIGRKH